MAVPDFQSLMLPVLMSLSNGDALRVADVCARVADAEGLTPDDLSERTRGGHTTRLKDRVSWSITHFLYAGLVERVRRAVYRITPEGKGLLARHPARIDLRLLHDYPAYVEWKNRTHRQSSHVEKPVPQNTEAEETPEETLDRAAGELRVMLEAEILDRVRNAVPEFLERAVVDLLIAMGYGGGDATMGRVTGRSGDGGIDGTIREDALGLDEVYVQAKKYAEGNAVGEGDLRNFAGAIDAAGTTKGVFVTTASFTRAASDYVARNPKRIILIDGAELARLMVQHGIDVRTRAFHVHIYFDVMNSATEYDDDDGKLWFLPPETVIPVEQRVLWRLLEFDAVDKTGYLAPVQAEAVIEAVMDGNIPPLHECEEEDAWRYRRELRELGGRIDELRVCRICCM